jgi:lipopolysaccharide transport protein LptA
VRRRAALLLRIAACLAWSVPVAAAQEAPVPAEWSIAVAPFEALGGADLPDLGGRVARRLAAEPRIRVVTPRQLALDRPVGRPEAAAVRRWAEGAGVEAVLVGTTERAAGGEGVAISAEVRSGHSGAALARYRTTARDAESAAAELAPVVLQVLDYRRPEPEHTALASLESGPEPVASAPPAEGEGGPQASEDRREQPISIRSDELEVIEEASRRHFVFTNNVRVVQADVELLSDRLEAFYATGASQPDHLEATGRVRVHQGDRRARCDVATYDRAEQLVICRGHAELVENCDRVRGQEIRFDLEGERVRVTGAPSVVIHPGDPGDGEQTSGCAEDAS